jgi:hypothetical protein
LTNQLKQENNHHPLSRFKNSRARRARGAAVITQSDISLHLSRNVLKSNTKACHDNALRRRVSVDFERDAKEVLQMSQVLHCVRRHFADPQPRHILLCTRFSGVTTPTLSVHTPDTTP